MRIQTIATRVVFCLVLLIAGLSLDAATYALQGRIESVRKGMVVSIIFSERPKEERYLIMDGDTVLGEAFIDEITYDREGANRFRILARITLRNPSFKPLIRPGVDITLESVRGRIERQYGGTTLGVEKRYRRAIVSPRDGRDMVLIPEGKCRIGADDSERDEMPEHDVFIKNYYIDRFEVSNRDYLRYVEAVNAPAPLSWHSGKPDDAEADLPVMVSYSEAEAYANWVKKRLPTEFEWEKAARGSFVEEDHYGGNRYPWGDRYDAGRCNALEFWASPETGREHKLRYKLENKGPAPVRSFDPEGASPYGVINMAGNAREWTSSWYEPYEGNRIRDRRYGRQYKVIRGGAWYSPRQEIRASNRDIGGLPSLRRDNSAGFRCVKDVSPYDQEN